MRSEFLVLLLLCIVGTLVTDISEESAATHLQTEVAGSSETVLPICQSTCITFKEVQLECCCFLHVLVFYANIVLFIAEQIIFFRFGLCDILRHGDRVVISPNRNLSIVSDSLGRVILIDNLKGLAIRMWKGMSYCNISFL